MARVPSNHSAEGAQEMVLTASEIAIRSGKNRTSVRKALTTVRPRAKVEAAGNAADAWDISALPADLRAKVDGYELSALADLVGSWRDKFSPTDLEASHLFNCAFTKLEDLVQAGAVERIMKTRQIAWLAKNVPSLARNEAALRRMYNRLLVAWRQGGRRLAPVLDGRGTTGAKARIAPKLPKQDLDQLVAAAVIKYNGSLSTAWQNCWSALSQETRNRYPLKREVPAKIRQAVMPEIQRLRPIHIGPRAAKLNGAYITRDYSNLYAGDVDSMDDHTVDVYIYDSVQPAVLFRPQLLLQIDVRSGLIYNFALELDRSWTAVTALGLMRRKARLYGLPREGYYWERGKFKDAKILGRGGFSNIFTDERESFADRLGIKIRHALPGNARAKVVERVIGAIAQRFAACPGYVGPDEMHVKYEHVQKAKQAVAAGRVHPADAGFLEVKEFEAFLTEQIEKYNSTPRDSEVTGRFISPVQAYEELQPRSSGEIVPVAKLPAEMEYLLSSYIEVVRVTRAGVSLFGGKYRYYSTETGLIQGEYCKAYFDPEHPEAICITDLDGNNVRTVPLLFKPDAWSAAPEDLSDASSLAASHNSAQRRRYTELKSKFYPPVRPSIVAPETLQRGRDMVEQKASLAERNRKLTALERRSKEEAEEAEIQRRNAETEAFIRTHELDFI